MIIVGLTGGIATGKSLVAGYLKELGAYIIDWDVIARAIEKPGLPAWQDIVSYFGKEILQKDGKLDRSKLGQIVFNDEAKLLKLNSFTHPRVIDEAKKQERAIVESDPNAVVVHDVPLLFEVGIDKMVDKTVAVYATEENQIERLRTRDGMSREDALSRIRSQMPVAEKVKRADYVIDNNGTMEETKKQVVELYRKLVVLARNITGGDYMIGNIAKSINWPVTLEGKLWPARGTKIDQYEFVCLDKKTIARLPQNLYGITCSAVKGQRNKGIVVTCKYADHSVIGQFHRKQNDNKVISKGIWIGSDYTNRGHIATTEWRNNFISYFGITVGIDNKVIDLYMDFYENLTIEFRKAPEACHP